MAVYLNTHHFLHVFVLLHTTHYYTVVQLSQSFKTVGCGCTSCWGDVGAENA